MSLPEPKRLKPTSKDDEGSKARRSDAADLGALITLAKDAKQKLADEGVGETADVDAAFVE